MHVKTTTSSTLAALLLLTVPALCHALDAAQTTMAAQDPVQIQALTTVYTPSIEAIPTYKNAATVDDNGDPIKEIDVWSRIRSGYAIADIDNELVAKHVAWYSTRPEHIAITTARASRYLFHVVQELQKRGMPTELALLPFIESAFNPQAFSSANAAGMWQFIPATGRAFNLKQTMFKDERRGVVASTDAALSYLQQLYGMFGDWQLALAAYNWGEGSVQRAIKKNEALGKPTDFESLAYQMPSETRNYVPKLQAIKNIIGNPVKYGLTLPKIDNLPYFTTVDKTSDIDMTIAAQLAELSLDEFKALNPQFNRPVITGSANTQLLLPKENAKKFHLNLEQWGQALSTWTTHKITSARERIDTLASKYGTTPEVLRQANNIPQKMLLSAGSTILVPRISTSLNIDIAPDIADNATINYVADRPERKRAAPGKHSKARTAAPISLVKDRIPRSAKTVNKHGTRASSR
jgi:membrane-bound lytic murein transglycosylase D